MKSLDRAFTLIEILIVTVIIGVITSIVVLNYGRDKEQFALQRSAYKLAQDIRRAQEMAMSGKEFQGEVPRGGYGVYFTIDEPTHYILFADINEDRQYSAGELVEDISLEKRIKIGELSSSPLNIVFIPPDPTVRFSKNASSISIAIEIEGRRVSVPEYNYEFFGFTLNHEDPRASCDKSESSIDCKNSFPASFTDPPFVYDWFKWWGRKFSKIYQKQETLTIISGPQKIIKLNRTGLIEIE